MSHEPQIPLCRSEFLQDFTIALGLNLQPENHGWRSFSAKADYCEHEGESLESTAQFGLPRIIVRG